MMSIKSILIHLTVSDSCLNRCRYAMALATQFKSRLSGIYIEPSPPPMLTSVTSPLAGTHESSAPISAGIEEHFAAIERKKHAINEMLASLSNREEPFTWSALQEPFGQSFAQACCYHDLAIVGDDLDSDDPLAFMSKPTAKLAVESGCPILVLPEYFDEYFAFDKPIVAWNGSREAARALRDAIPFLQRADSVTVLSSRSQTEAAGGLHRRRDSLLRYLCLQNVDAAYVDEALEGEAFGEAVAEHVKSNRHDFLVMGAYDHSRVRELLLGSATRSLLGNVPVPILLSN